MRRIVLTALLVLSLPAIAAAQVVGIHENQNKDIRLFRNVSGANIISGTAVIFDMEDSNSVTGSRPSNQTTIGYDVNTTTVDDSRVFAGVLYDENCADDRVCRFVVEGPAQVRWAGATDNSNSIGNGSQLAAQVGTTSVAGRLGAGTGAGWLMSLSVNNSGDGDNAYRWVFLQRQAP